MSRSFRHTTKTGNVRRTSEATDKQNWHQRLRVKVRSAMANLQSDLDTYLDPDKREVSSVNAMSKHGKIFITPSHFDVIEATGGQREVLSYMCK